MFASRPRAWRVRSVEVRPDVAHARTQHDTPLLGGTRGAESCAEHTPFLAVLTHSGYAARDPVAGIPPRLGGEDNLRSAETLAHGSTCVRRMRRDRCDDRRNQVIESVSLAEVIAAAQGRHASLVPETSGYILLGIVRAMGGRPMKVDPRDIRLDTDGVVAIDGRRERRPPSVTAAGLRELLRRLLAVGQGNPTTLAAVADPPGGADVPLDKLFTGVTRALIPINRSAAKRALARLARETLRAKARRHLDDDAMRYAQAGWDQAAEDAETPPKADAVPEPPAAEETDEVAESEPSEPMAVAPRAPRAEVAPSRTPSPTPSIAVDVAEDDDWDEIDADIDLLTPTPRPTVEPTPTLMDPAIDEKHEIAAVEAAEPGPGDEVMADDEGGERVSSDTEPTAETIEEDELDIEIDVAPMVALTPAPTTTAHDDDDLSWSLHAAVVSKTDGDSAAEPSESPTGDAAEESTEDSAEGEAAHTPAAGGTQLNPAREPDTSHHDAPVAPAPAMMPQTETELAELLYEAAAALRPTGVRPDQPTFAKAPGEQGSVEDLLNQLDASDRDQDPVLAAAASLQSMMGLDLSPFPASVMAMTADDLVEDDEEDDASAPFALATRDEHDDDLEDDDDLDDDLDHDDDDLEHDEESVDGDVDEPESDESLEDDALVARSLPDAGVDEAPSPVDGAEDGEGVAQSISPPPTAVTDRFTTTPPPRRRWPAALGAAAVLAVSLVAAQTLLKDGPLDVLADRLAEPAGGETSTGQCVAELRLHDLPERHEVLLGLGEAPLTTRPVPTGVRLELVATASAFEPERVVIPVDANWVEVEEGRRQLAVSMTLERGVSDHWPPAPAGKVGGIGAAGRIHVATEPNAEIWLVAAAGRGADTTVAVACGADANLLIVDRSQPHRQRRLSVASALLDTAARSGGADLSGKL